MNELLERYKVTRTKRVSSRIRAARKRSYRKNKSRSKQRAKRNRRKSSFKRRIKRLRQIRKRMHIKPGSRRRLRVANNDRVANMNEGLSMKHMSNYSREEILKCLRKANLTALDGKDIEKHDTEVLRKALSKAVQDGDASELKEGNDLEDSMPDQETILDGYLTTMLWSSVDDNDEPLDANFDITDIAPETVEKAKQDIKEFVAEAGDLLDGLDAGQVGHDFWLTRCGHGAGFWDGDYEKEVGEKLTAISKMFGNIDPIVGDDKKIYAESRRHMENQIVEANEKKIKDLQDKIQKAQADGDSDLAKKLGYELSDLTSDTKDELSPEQKKILTNTGLGESKSKWADLVEARKSKVQIDEAKGNEFSEEFEFTEELEKALEKYGYMDDVDVSEESRVATLKPKVAKDLKRTKELFLSQKYADKYIETAKATTKKYVEDLLKKESKALKGKVDVEVRDEIGGGYVGAGNGSIYITLESDAGDVEVESQALHYSGSDDVVYEDMTQWNWCFWLASDDSPFQSSDWVESYEYDRIGQALDHFAAVLDESDLKFELKKAFAKIEHDLHLSSKEGEEEDESIEFKHPKGVNSKRTGKGRDNGEEQDEARNPIHNKDSHEKGVHGAAKFQGNRGMSKAGELARVGSRGAVGLAKQAHKEKLRDLKDMPNPKLEDTAGGENVMRAAVERLEAECNAYLKKKGIKAPSNKMYKNEYINFKITGYDEAMTQKEDGKDVHYPEMISFNVESRNTMKLSYLSDGRIIREGTNLSGKGMTKEQLFEKVADDVAEWSNASAKNSMKKEDSGDKKVGDYEITNHGVMWSDYFQGHSIAMTKWDDCATGIGGSEREAYEDALEQLAQNGWEISPEMEADVQKASDEDVVPHDADESYCYVSVDVKASSYEEATESDKRIANLRESINEFEKAIEPTTGQVFVEAFKTSVRVAKNLQEAYQKVVELQVKEQEEVVDEFNIPLPDFTYDPKQDDALHEDFSDILGIKKAKTSFEQAKDRIPKTDLEAAKLVIEDLKSLQEQSSKLAVAAEKGLLDEAEAKNFLKKTQKYLDGAIEALSEDEYLDQEHPQKEDDDFDDREDEPDHENDIFFQDSGRFGAMTAVSAGGKHLGEFKSEEEAERAAKDWMKQHNMYPNIWTVSDHGNIHQRTLDMDEGVEEAGNKGKNLTYILLDKVADALAKSGFEPIEPNKDDYVLDIFKKGKRKLGYHEITLHAVGNIEGMDSIYGVFTWSTGYDETGDNPEHTFDIEVTYDPHDGEIEGIDELISALETSFEQPKKEGVEEARVVTDKVAQSFAQGMPKKMGNTSTDGHSFFLHGNKIVKREKNGDVFITDAGWPTPTTRERINGVLQALGVDAGVWQVKGEQSIQIGRDKKRWDGSWTLVGSQSPDGSDDSVGEATLKKGLKWNEPSGSVDIPKSKGSENNLPRSNRNISKEEFNKLRSLKSKLKDMDRQDPDYDETQLEISKILGFTKVEDMNEKYMGFKKLKDKLGKGGIKDPAALAASIGRKKYGSKEFAKMSASGKKSHESVNESKLKVSDIPKDYPVQPLKPGQEAKDKATCGECGLSWDDSISTSMTPAPSARCPFENFHKYDESVNEADGGQVDMSVYIDLVEDGNITSGKTPVIERGVSFDSIKKTAEQFAEEIEDMFDVKNIRWFKGSDGKDGLYTSQSCFVTTEEFEKMREYFKDSDVQNLASEVEVMFVLGIDGGKLTGRELIGDKDAEESLASPMKDVEEAVKVIMKTKDLREEAIRMVESRAKVVDYDDYLMRNSSLFRNVGEIQGDDLRRELRSAVVEAKKICESESDGKLYQKVFFKDDEGKSHEKVAFTGGGLNTTGTKSVEFRRIVPNAREITHVSPAYSSHEEASKYKYSRSKKSEGISEDSMSGQVFNKDNKFFVKDPKSGGYYPMKDQSAASKLVGAMVNFSVDNDKNAEVTETKKPGWKNVKAIKPGANIGTMVKGREKNYNTIIGKGKKESSDSGKMNEALINDVAEFQEALKNGPYAWPGGYPTYFLTADGGVLSFEAAEENIDLIKSAIQDKGTDEQWEVVSQDVNWEDGNLVCDHTGKEIECAYPSDEPTTEGKKRVWKKVKTLASKFSHIAKGNQKNYDTELGMKHKKEDVGGIGVASIGPGLMGGKMVKGREKNYDRLLGKKRKGINKESLDEAVDFDAPARVKASTMSVLMSASKVKAGSVGLDSSIMVGVDVKNKGGKSGYTNLTLRFDRGEAAVLAGYPMEWGIYDVNVDYHDTDSPTYAEVIGNGEEEHLNDMTVYVSKSTETEIFKQLKKSLEKQFKDPMFKDDLTPELQAQALAMMDAAIAGKGEGHEEESVETVESSGNKLSPEEKEKIENFANSIPNAVKYIAIPSQNKVDIYFDNVNATEYELDSILRGSPKKAKSDPGKTNGGEKIEDKEDSVRVV